MPVGLALLLTLVQTRQPPPPDCRFLDYQLPTPRTLPVVQP
ncbi:MAG TPA: hypothetical protein VLD67_09655 [Vicinamibacterales bacterium]|nr:hypothetical protein [Vicinamibacterales bacterium]